MSEFAARQKSVFVVDDHPIVRQGLVQLIEQEPDLKVCGEAADVKEARASLAKLTPDIVILDLSLRDSDGLELVKDIRSKYQQLPVLVLSMHDESIYAERLLSAGANGYIMKQAAAADLYRIAQEAIRNAARHSAAKEIRLTLAADDERLTLTIEDDGRGIMPGAETRAGMGMKIMRYRASIIGALLEIGARKHGGTIVRCVLRQAAEGDTPGEKND